MLAMSEGLPYSQPRFAGLLRVLGLRITGDQNTDGFDHHAEYTDGRGNPLPDKPGRTMPYPPRSG